MANPAPISGDKTSLEVAKFVQPGGAGTQVYVATIPSGNISANLIQQGGQARIATGGTPVQIAPANSYVLQNGMILTAAATNTGTAVTYSYSTITPGTAVDGTGNANWVYPGGKDGIPAGVLMSAIYINSTAVGDAVGWAGN